MVGAHNNQSTAASAARRFWEKNHWHKLMRPHTAIAFCIAWPCLNASAAPQFSDYAAARYEGCVRQVRIEGGKSREFRHSLIADAARPGWKAPR